MLNKCYSNKLKYKKNRYIDRFIFLFHEARQIGIRQMGKNNIRSQGNIGIGLCRVRLFVSHQIGFMDVRQVKQVVR